MIGSIWRHYKGDLYRVLHLATDANNVNTHLDQQVIYVRIQDDRVFVRGLDEFLEKFEKKED